MREILYRAKTTPKENGEFNNIWVQGDLITSNGKYYIHPKGNLVSVIGDLGRLVVMHEVDPDTICQYTGLTDKNGNKIWENDVVYIPYERLEDSYCKVVFKRGAFIGEMVDGCEDCIVNRKTEVIGNIFDNPELLKVENT